MDFPSDYSYVSPRIVQSPAECIFYHTIDLPGIGLVDGAWDLRTGIADYLGRVDFSGKRALDIGTASGALCFEMERQGAEVVAYDLCEDSTGWDLVPFDGAPDPVLRAERSAGMSKINNGYWLAHRALHSKARVAYGSVYDLPVEIGAVDVTVFGAVLLHLRDPFLALQRGANLTTETVVVTEVASGAALALRRLPSRAQLRVLQSDRLPATMALLAKPARRAPQETWWTLPPRTVSRMLQVLGFVVITVIFHTKPFYGQETNLYTVVGRRPRGQRAPCDR